MRIPLLAAAALSAAIAGFGAQAAEAKENSPRPEVPIFEGLGLHTRTVTTSSPLAQQYFNQGLAFLHAFNHDEAIRSFEEATRQDPGCAMAWWGMAYANGPHINFPMMPPDRVTAAWAALGHARAHASNGTTVEQALIEALGHRYANPQPEDRAPLDAAFAEAMRKVWRANPTDADVGAFFAEAMMDLRPWNQWTPEGEAQPGTDEVLATLEAVFALNENHPLANHLYIHATEASPNPARADAAADRLRNLQPGMGHNVHMPSHIDVLRGRWQAAIDANVKAVATDVVYRETSGKPQGFFRLYMAHNQHMLAWAAMMTGQQELALRHIRQMVADIPSDFLDENIAWMDGFASMPYEVLVRFGLWDEILAEPAPPENRKLSRALHHAARGIAFAAKGDVTSARNEQAASTSAAAEVPGDFTSGNNTATAILAIVGPMLDGEILYRSGEIDAGLSRLQDAVAAEDTLRYDEPPGWILPVRHSLGASLIKEKRYAEAEQVYRADLKKLPANGWSLFGLAQALHGLAKHDEAAEVESKFEMTWAKADIQISSSCLCVPGDSE